MKKKLTIHSEVAYVIALLLLSFSVAMLTAADFGVSMIVAPALVLFRAVSRVLPWFTFGQAEYFIQGVLFVGFCIAVRRVRPVWLVSFGTGVLYGLFLDGWRALIPLFNETVTAPGSMPLIARVVMFIVGHQLTSLAVAIMFRIYLYPQVYDFVVKGLTAHFGWDRIRFKRIFDFGMLALSVVLSVALFPREFFALAPVGIGWGTVLMTVTNGILIGWWDRFLARFTEMPDLFPRVGQLFSLEDKHGTNE